jgi:hypothetical protein
MERDLYFWNIFATILSHYTGAEYGSNPVSYSSLHQVLKLRIYGNLLSSPSGLDGVTLKHWDNFTFYIHKYEGNSKSKVSYV